MRRIVSSILVAAALAACAHGTSLAVNEGKAIAGAWATLKFAANASDVVVKSGKMSPPTARTIADDLRKATAILQAADALYAANHNADVGVQIAQAAALVSEILSIVSPQKPTAAVLRYDWDHDVNPLV